MRKLWPGLLALVAVTIFGVANLGRLPDQVATHWGIAGEPNGWTSRNLAVVILPGIGLLLAALLAWFPRLDPKRANFPLHAEVWWLLGNVIILFLAALQLFVVGEALGWAIPIDRVTGFGVGALMVVLGNYLTRVRQNWFLGIRTPWTLSSERSWRETHRLGGRLFVLGGLLLVVVTAITGGLRPWALIAGAGLPALVSLVYSYLVWRDDPEAGGRAS